MSVLNQISEKVQAGKSKDVKTFVRQALDEGFSPKQIIDEGFISAMNIVGEKFKNGDIYVPEVLVSARAMNAGVEILKPLMTSSDTGSIGKICIGTVRGDLHDIGKNLVKLMMEGKGIEVLDLGVDVSPEKFVDAAKTQGCKIICCSALLTTTMGAMKDVVDLCISEGIRDSVKIMIGGAPVTDDFAKSIGADAYTPDAASASDAALEFLKNM